MPKYDKANEKGPGPRQSLLIHFQSLAATSNRPLACRLKRRRRIIERERNGKVQRVGHRALGRQWLFCNFFPFQKTWRYYSDPSGAHFLSLLEIIVLLQSLKVLHGAPVLFFRD